MTWNRSAHAGWVAIVLVAGLLIAMWGGLTGAQEGEAQVRIMHAGHGIVGPVDVFIDGNLAIEALEYADATGYLPLPAGEYDVQVTAAGGEQGDAVIEAMVTLDAGIPHTVVAIGPADQADIIVIVDDHTPPSADMAKLSLVNATSDGVSIGLALGDATVLIDEVQFADASAYVELDSGALDFVISSTETGDEVASISGFSAEPDTTYSIFTMGIEGEYQAVAFVDAAGEGPAPDPASTATPSEASPTATTTGGTPGTTATAATTPVATTATPTGTPAQPPATPTIMPALPATGAGGESSGGGDTLWLAVGAGLMTLSGIAIWRFGYLLPRGRA